MSNTRDIVHLLIQKRSAHNTDGARITIKSQDETQTRYIEIFIWGADIPDEEHFATTTIVESDVDLASLTAALKTIPVSCVAASFILTEYNYDLTSLRPLSGIIQGIFPIQMREFWTKDISWKHFQRMLPSKAPRIWDSLQCMTLDLSVDTLEDQACCMNVLMKGDLRRFLSQLRMLQHLSLSFYSELPGHDVLCSHAPFEHMLETQTAWRHLRSIHLDGFDSTAQELLSFLHSHSSTLTKLTLRNYFLLSGSWMEVLPELRDYVNLQEAEVAGAVEACNELWLIKVPGVQENCFLAEDLAYWLTHPKANLSCPLSKRNLVWRTDPQEEDWE